MRSADTDIAERLIELCKARLVELDVHAIAGMKALHVTLIAIAAGVQSRAAEGFGEIRRKALVMLRMKLMLEWMCSRRIFKAQRMPSPA